MCSAWRCLHAALGGTKRDEHREPDVDSTPVERLQRVGHKARRHAGTDPRFGTVPGFEISCVPGLQFRDGKDIVRLDREVAAGLAREFDTPEPGIALIDREVCLSQEGVRRIVPGLLVASPCDAARPNAALTTTPYVMCVESSQ